MQEQPEDLPELSRNQNIDKPKHQENINKDGKSNPADILSKHWEFANIWPLLKPLLLWKGDINELSAKAKGSDRIPVKKNLV